MAFICKLGEHTLAEKLCGGGGLGVGGASVMSGTGRNAPGRSWPDSLHPIPSLLPSSHWQAVDWGLRLAATFSQKAREIQYWEWMATSCCQCCNLGNRQSTILVPPTGHRNGWQDEVNLPLVHTHIQKGEHTTANLLIRALFHTVYSIIKPLNQYFSTFTSQACQQICSEWNEMTGGWFKVDTNWLCLYIYILKNFELNYFVWLCIKVLLWASELLYAKTPHWCVWWIEYGN